MTAFEKTFANARGQAVGVEPLPPSEDAAAPQGAHPQGPMPSPLGLGQPLDAARSGHAHARQAVHAMGPGAAMALLYQPLPGGLASQFFAATGEDVSSVQIAENPDLLGSGHRGVAVEGHHVEVAPGLLTDRGLCLHELVHIVQQRGPRAPEADAPSRDPEAEAISGASAILAGQPFHISARSDQARLFEEAPPDDCGSTMGTDACAVPKPPSHQVNVSDTGGCGTERAHTLDYQDYCLNLNRAIDKITLQISNKRQILIDLLAREDIWWEQQNHAQIISQIDHLEDVASRIQALTKASEIVCNMSRDEFHSQYNQISAQLEAVEDAEQATKLAGVPAASILWAMSNAPKLNPWMLAASIAATVGIQLIISKIQAPPEFSLLKETLLAQRGALQPNLQQSLALTQAAVLVLLSAAELLEDIDLPTEGPANDDEEVAIAVISAGLVAAIATAKAANDDQDPEKIEEAKELIRTEARKWIKEIAEEITEELVSQIAEALIEQLFGPEPGPGIDPISPPLPENPPADDDEPKDNSIRIVRVEWLDSFNMAQHSGEPYQPVWEDGVQDHAVAYKHGTIPKVRYTFEAASPTSLGIITVSEGSNTNSTLGMLTGEMTLPKLQRSDQFGQTSYTLQWTWNGQDAGSSLHQHAYWTMNQPLLTPPNLYAKAVDWATGAGSIEGIRESISTQLGWDPGNPKLVSVTDQLLNLGGQQVCGTLANVMTLLCRSVGINATSEAYYGGFQTAKGVLIAVYDQNKHGKSYSMSANESDFTYHGVSSVDGTIQDPAINRAGMSLTRPLILLDKSKDGRASGMLSEEFVKALQERSRPLVRQTG